MAGACAGFFAEPYGAPHVLQFTSSVAHTPEAWVLNWIKFVLVLILQAWALAGIAVYGVLTALNLFWFCKLVRLALQASSAKRPAKDLAAVQPSSKPAAVNGITAVSAHAAWSDVMKRQGDHARIGRCSAVQHSQQIGRG